MHACILVHKFKDGYIITDLGTILRLLMSLTL
jgi:hypothetical protein